MILPKGRDKYYLTFGGGIQGFGEEAGTLISQISLPSDVSSESCYGKGLLVWKIGRLTWGGHMGLP